MSQEAQSDAPHAAGRLAAKLQALFDVLPDDEKAIMARIMRLAVERADVEGYAAGPTGPGTAQHLADLPEPDLPNPIDDFRANLGLYLRPDE